MSRSYLQTQDIFNKVFQNNSKTLRASGYNSEQDCLNAVFDTEKSALRINFDGGMLPAASDVSSLPSSATLNSICPVIDPETKMVEFYQWDGINWNKLEISGQNQLSPEEQIALSWLASNIDRVRQLASYEYLVKMEEIVLSADTSVPVVLNIQGEYQNINDSLDSDGEPATHYRIDICGYVLGIETYANSYAVVPDRYYTKIMYEPKSADIGISHIYLEKDEYEYFANLLNGKNLIRAFYMSNVFPGVVNVKHETITLPDAELAPVLIDIQGNVQDIDDDGDKDGEVATHYRIDINGYVLDVEGYNSSEEIAASRFLVKMNYDSGNNVTSIYLTKEEYEQISQLTNGKNQIKVFYLAQQ